MQPQAVLDQAKVDQFVGKVLGDTSATLVTLLAAIGDRLGLFKELAASGPATSADLASRTGTNERYAVSGSAEWRRLGILPTTRLHSVSTCRPSTCPPSRTRVVPSSSVAYTRCFLRWSGSSTKS